MPTHTLTPDALTLEGDVTATLNGESIPIPLTIPGETIEIEVLEGRRGSKIARLTGVVDASPHRVEPPCPYFGECGGCQWQHISYSHQLEMKRRILKLQLEEGGLVAPNVAPTIPSPLQSEYRNHARFTVHRDGKLGFTKTGTRRPMEIDRCLLMHDEINAILSQLQGKGKGLHQVAVRYGVNTADLLVQPSLNIPDAKVKSGQSHFTEALFGYTFRVSSPSFFQVNTPQAERMAAELRDRLDPTGNELLIDAYGGVATFAVLLAPYYREIISLEESPSAIDDAFVNCRPFPNITVFKGKTEDELPRLGAHPDVVILDPPRTGCHPGVLQTLASVAPQKVAYVSCAPNTLARDLAYLTSNGYSLTEAVPIDMFPQTRHVESISILERN